MAKIRRPAGRRIFFAFFLDHALMSVL